MKMPNILSSIKRIALSENEYHALLKDETTLGGLILLLSNDSPSTLQDILEIFLILSKKKSGPQYLSKLRGFKDQLMKLSQFDQETSSTISQFATEIFKLIYCDAPSKERVSYQRHHKTRKPSAIVVQLTGNLTQSLLSDIESQLISIKGVVSITFQLAKSRVIVMALDDVDPAIILQKVTAGCSVKSAEGNESSVSARVIRRQKSTCFRAQHRENNRAGDENDGRSCVTASTRLKHPAAAPPTPALNPLLPYLAESADLFGGVAEGDRGGVVQHGTEMPPRSLGGGVRGWITDFLEKNIFW